MHSNTQSVIRAVTSIAGGGRRALGEVTWAATMAGVVSACRTLRVDPTVSLRPINQVRECPFLNLGTYNWTDCCLPRAYTQAETLPYVYASRHFGK